VIGVSKTSKNTGGSVVRTIGVLRETNLINGSLKLEFKRNPCDQRRPGQVGGREKKHRRSIPTDPRGAQGNLWNMQRSIVEYRVG